MVSFLNTETMRAIPEVDDAEHLAIIDGGFSSQISAEMISLPVPPPSAPTSKNKVGHTLAAKRPPAPKRKSTSSAGSLEDHEQVEDNNSDEDEIFEAPRKSG